MSRIKRIGICENCKREIKIHCKRVCIACYLKLYFTPRIIQCSRCNKKTPHHAKGFCTNCYNSLFFSEVTKKWGIKRAHHIDVETYRRITKECLICGFDKFVELHHIDKNHDNTSESNLVCLCPNHHKMIHTDRYRDEMMLILRQKLLTREVSATSLLNQPTTEAPIQITLLNHVPLIGN